MGNVLACVGCVYEASMPNRSLSWEGMPHPSGHRIEFQFGNMRNAGTIDLATGECTEMPEWFNASDFVHLAAVLSEQASGMWHLNGAQVFPTITTMYKGSAYCMLHLVAEMGTERLRDGSESVA